MFSILVDITKCSGCEKCIEACIKKNKLNLEKADYDRATSKDGLSADRLLSIKKIEEGHFARYSCMHCVEPACVSACLVGGITKSAEGPVIYDSEKCIGCRYCMLACPFHIPRYEWSETKPFMKKCNMCYERIKENEIPSCVQACSYNAIIFGERNVLLKHAHSIINSNKIKYINHVWGEKEFGGTSLLYISDVDLGDMGWPSKLAKPIPDVTEPLIEKTPVIGLAVGGCLVGLNWIIKRRMEFAGQNDSAPKNEREEDGNEK